ncbi:MAG: malate synthase, partial [Planctomycetota bacterium]
LYVFHNGRRLLERASGPYFYLPKLESHLEARLWNDAFVLAEDRLGLPPGGIRATVLVETIPAAFEMDEILWELRDHSAGLNCGRWDYIFSFIKKSRSRPDCVLPDRASVTMDRPFLRSYSLLLIQTCHRRGAHAMGGMAAQIPIKADPERNRIALEKVRADKRREAGDGHDGTWVAHPGLVETARTEFDAVVRGRHQIDRLREDVEVGAADLLAVPEGRITEAGLRQNLDVGVRYLEAWLRGIGCVPLYDLMEDAATAEISRTQVWQWVRHGARLEDGRPLEESRVRRTLEEQMERMRGDLGSSRFEAGRFGPARDLFERLILSPQLEDFLTLPAYEHLLRFEEGGKESL